VSEFSVTSDVFDVAIVGTGFAESMLSGALARAGRSVVHVDPHDHYGCDDASFTVDQFVARFCGAPAEAECAAASPVDDAEWLPLADIASGCVRDVSVRVDEAAPLTAAQLRRCIVDLWPRLLFARSPMIDALVRSGVNRYLEFKCLHACFMHVDGVGLTLVPASKADVFRDQTLSLIQKRALMKLFAAIVGTAPTDAALPTSGSFDALLSSANLGALASAFTKHAIALDPSPVVDDESSRERNLARCRQYAQSIGVYGPTPFLAALYGAGELAQAYCRMAAVFGATFILKCGAVSLLRDANGATSVRALRCDAGDIRAKQFVIAGSLAPPAALAPTDAVASHRLHVGSCVLSGSLMPANADVQLPFIVVPPLSGRNAYSVYAMQLDPSMSMTAAGLYSLCMWTRAADDSSDTADAVFDRILPLLMPVADAPRVLWRAAWSRTVMDGAPPQSRFDNVHVIGNASGEVDLDATVAQVEAAFRKLCPGVEFIERVPNPEDVEWSAAPAEQQQQQQQQQTENNPTPSDES
jgi:RAB protein geranylgeranyltransferase component A